jgi:hypothetical protein
LVDKKSRFRNAGEDRSVLLCVSVLGGVRACGGVLNFISTIRHTNRAIELWLDNSSHTQELCYYADTLTQQ